MTHMVSYEENTAACIKGDAIVEEISEIINQHAKSSLGRLAVLEALANCSAHSVFWFHMKQDPKITSESADWFINKFIFYLNKCRGTQGDA